MNFSTLTELHILSDLYGDYRQIIQPRTARIRYVQDVNLVEPGPIGLTAVSSDSADILTSHLGYPSAKRARTSEQGDGTVAEELVVS